MLLTFDSFLVGSVWLLHLCLCQATPHVSSSQIVSYAALGDSYATGAGAGSPRLLPVGCGAFSDAYPVQVANSTSLDVEESRFQDLACGGASTASVLHAQVPRIGESQIVTMTVGGNEVDFFAVVNECIYRWRPLSTCDKELQRSRSLIESTEFISNYNKLVKGAVQALRPGARLLVTGYARFFNQETEYCSHVSFSKSDPSSLLTRPLRTELNDLIDRLNDVIEAAARVHGAEYVDIDGAFEGHRFCEDGVLEPAPERRDTWFFSMTYDRSSGASPPDDMLQQLFPTPFKGFFDFARTFHPTSPGHAAIKDEILKHILHNK